ncbi:hypothetical protein R0131_03390 [Clostridium sp. AL.422]|uniref:hypothetical protein n=1 Tax=Clostridium TaxID=1485 RepID=UPI00293DD8FC|nr:MULTISPECIES: hypothetical protein [unclassified Clostridium]MDV4149870.1 hypothetical protein [Clostridium sp. AL.422]
MISKIKALPHKKIMLLGITILLVDIIFYLVISITYEIASNMLLKLIYNILFFIGMMLMAIAHKKKVEGK